MLELEFKNLSLGILSKPRTCSHILELSLGGLFLKDKITLNTMFPILVGPPGFDRTFVQRGKPSPRLGLHSSSSGKLEETVEHLFYLLYEKKPLQAGSDYR